MDGCTIFSQHHNIPSKCQNTALKIWENLQEINQLDQVIYRYAYLIFNSAILLSKN